MEMIIQMLQNNPILLIIAFGIYNVIMSFFVFKRTGKIPSVTLQEFTKVAEVVPNSSVDIVSTDIEKLVEFHETRANELKSFLKEVKSNDATSN